MRSAADLPDPSSDGGEGFRRQREPGSEESGGTAGVAEQALNPNATGFDWGFKGWFMYGSDTRYSKSLGLLDTTTDYMTQPDFPEIYVSVHVPIPGTNGLDVKGGKYQDPMTVERILEKQSGMS